MAIDYEVDVRQRRVRVEVAGVVTARDGIEFLHRLASDPAYDPGMLQLVDCTRLSEPPTAADSERVADALQRLRDSFTGARFAVLVSSPVMYGVIRQFGSLATRASVVVRPFLDLTEATDWLESSPGRDRDIERPL